MQQYRKSNVSHVFCLNCTFVIDATVKHLTSRSFVKCGVSAIITAAHKICAPDLRFMISQHAFTKIYLLPIVQINNYISKKI